MYKSKILVVVDFVFQKSGFLAGGVKAAEDGWLQRHGAFYCCLLRLGIGLLLLISGHVVGSGCVDAAPSGAVFRV